ncbi:histidine kinase N-terminal 7TM domain-containing protein [Halovivax cerinus]|uniref:histidine kinase n=1 Tax=Halovivax cerinus TaxID=1487865 RepID=A0ABD5NM68_9EURY|nr:histidine kinase N-terminal 7TM domain-containing protein [Halovivax cerinus]
MSAIETAYLVGLGIATVVSLGIAALAVQHRERTDAFALTVLTTGMAIWAGGDLMSALVVSRSATIRWVQVSWVGVAVVPVAIFCFVVIYTDRWSLTPARVAGLAVVPAVTVGLVLTNPAHQLIWTAIEASTQPPSGYAFDNGPAYVVFTVYSYLLLAIATGILGTYLAASTGLYRGQIVALLVGALTPWASNVFYVTGWVEINATSLGFAISATAFAVAVLEYRLIDISPIARRTVFEQITDGVVVLDREVRVSDVNSSGAAFLDLDPQRALGQRATAVLPATVADWLAADTDGEDELVTDEGSAEQTGDNRTASRGPTRSTTVGVRERGESRQLSATKTTLYDDNQRVGQLLILRDVTERHRYERELERQNERLDRFASVVSHDLRNPLNVADGYLSILAERHDDPEIDEIETSLDRMEDIIEDVLTLARHGDAVSDRTVVELSTITDRAWNGVDTADASLRIETGGHRVAADASRLTQALENLFRNTVEHGGTDVTVTVGTIAADGTDGSTGERSAAPDTSESAGFYVADDGVGIPEDAREDVLESGYTTNQDGTGLGLDIVGQIVEAHGWSLAVTESIDGGARFEIRYEPAHEPDGDEATGVHSRPS